MSVSYEQRRATLLANRAKRRQQGAPKGGKGRLGKKTIPMGQLIRAIRRSCGNKSEIARRLKVTRAAVVRMLDRPGWEKARKVYEQETESVLDLAEATCVDMMRQRVHLPTASKTATWFLSMQSTAQKRGFSNRKTVVVEGGDKPIKLDVNLVPVSELPIEVRKAMLDALDVIEAEKRERERIPPRPAGTPGHYPTGRVIRLRRRA